ncbi:hypothetical protein C8R47DRAFT_1226696 [Mycena vitilis]|nr:hypothetical protein C8R47DRAFT_1226696 [Mycena vitilis]
MDAVVFPVGSRNNCFSCDATGDPVLRQCSKCRVARYCSSACQAADWPEHRRFCVDRDTLFDSYSGMHMPAEVRQFLKWLDYWRLSSLRWAVYSADLAHQHSDYLSFNCFVLLMSQRSTSDGGISTKSMYDVVQAGMRSNKDIVDEIGRFPVVGKRQRLINDFNRGPRRSDVVRAIIMTDNCYTVECADLPSLFSLYPPALFSSIRDAQSRSLATALKWEYITKFDLCVSTGKVDECNDLLLAALRRIAAVNQL